MYINLHTQFIISMTEQENFGIKESQSKESSDHIFEFLCSSMKVLGVKYIEATSLLDGLVQWETTAHISTTHAQLSYI